MGAVRKSEHLPLRAAWVEPKARRQAPGPFLHELEDLTPADEIADRVAELRRSMK